MNARVIYYSRTGMTCRVCREIASRLSVPFEAIEEDIDRSGPLGYLQSAMDALAKRSSPIHAITSPLAQCDRIIIGTPVWCGTLPPPVRTFLQNYRAHFRKVSFVVTMGNWGAKRVFREMASLCELEPDGTVFFRTREVQRGLYPETVAVFVDRIVNTRENI